VTTGTNCPWTASTNSGSWSWIAITSGWSGTGSGTVNYSVLANNTGATRTGTLTIAGHTFTITQQPQQGACANIAANWSGTANYWGEEGEEVRIFFYLSQNGCNVSGTFQSPDSCPALCGFGAGGNITGTVSGNIFTFTILQDPLVDCDTCEFICYGTDHASLTIDGDRMYGIVQSEDCETGMFDDVEVNLTRSDSVYSINNLQEKRGIGKSSLFFPKGHNK
jgi:hypothetical protein